MNDVRYTVNLSCETGEVTRMMFVHTADYNYIMARRAFLCNMPPDFLWLSLHSIEKYLKATLLFNGKSSKGYGHDINKLYKSVISLDERISLSGFIKPQKHSFDWFDENIDEYIKRLNRYGAADNRYNIYGYHTRVSDLMKLDQIIWSIRRICSPLLVEIPTEGGSFIYDHIEHLNANPLEWRKEDQGLLLEKLIDAPSEYRNRIDFLQANSAFGLDEAYEPVKWMTSAHCAPFARWLEILQRRDSDPDSRRMATDVMSWAIANIQFNSNDMKIIKKLLDQQHSALSTGFAANT